MGYFCLSACFFVVVFLCLFVCLFVAAAAVVDAVVVAVVAIVVVVVVVVVVAIVVASHSSLVLPLFLFLKKKIFFTLFVSQSRTVSISTRILHGQLFRYFFF